MLSNRSMTVCAMVLICTASMAALASADTFVAEGRLFSAQSENKAIAQVMPVEAHYAFGTAQGQPLFTVQKTAPTAHADVLDGVTDLWTFMDGQPLALTSGEAVIGARWSEALDRILYWNDEKEVVLVDRTGGARQVLVDNAISPALSADGGTLAYVATPEDWRWDYHQRTFEIRLLDIDTGEDRLLLGNTDAHSLVFGPDGRFLVFQASPEGVTSLFRVSLANGETEQLTNHGLRTAKSPYFVKNPSRTTDIHWSADGSKLLYTTTYSEAGEVMVLLFDDQDRVEKALHLADGHNAFWRDDETVVVVRPGMEDLTKADASMRLSEFPIDAFYAESVVDVANAPRAAQKIELPAAAQAPTKATNRYRYPLHATAGYPFTSYYDNNNSYGADLDWRCTTYGAYDQHRGTDIGVNGWWVYAGAHGNLSTYNTGCPDTGYIGSNCGYGFGNYIKLSHGYADGRSWYTIYAHMRSSSVVASNHNCGSRVGITASSGNSSGPHLHFEVNAWGHPYDDPFSGSCSGPTSYWCNQNGGSPSASCC